MWPIITAIASTLFFPESTWQSSLIVSSYNSQFSVKVLVLFALYY